MLVDFHSLPENSRIWVYQADRPFTDTEINAIEESLSTFVSNWKRHGDNLKASFLIKYKQFVILAVDENYNDVSGCSIDASVHIIQKLQQQLNIDLLNKMKVTFKDGDSINTVSMSAFKEYAKLNKITSKTLVFNNLINSKAELKNSWEVEAGQSWHAKFLN